MTDAETLYRQLGRLIEEMPDLTVYPVTKEIHLWVARAYALVEAVNVGADAACFRIATNNLGTSIRHTAAIEITAYIYRAFAYVEALVAPAARGAFIPVGNSFDAYAALSKLFQTATSNVLLIDPYMDETALTEFGVAVPEGVTLRLLADEANHKPSLIPAATKWTQQHGAKRPLQVRLAPARTLHDRAILLDQAKAWTLTQSLKDFAKRSPAEIVRADDTAALKIAAYEAIWNNSRVIV